MKTKQQKRNEQVLDLTNNQWKHNPEWKFVGHTITTRPYHRKILVLSLVLMGCSVIFPDFGIMTYAGLNLLRRKG